MGCAWEVVTFGSRLEGIELFADSGGDVGGLDADVVSQTRSVINRLGERGFFEFGDLLSS